MADAPVQITLPKVGDYVLFGRFKNKRGRVTKLWKDDKSGAVKIEISPIPRGRKKTRQMGLLNVRLMDQTAIAEAKRLEIEESRKDKTAQLLVLKVAARFAREEDSPRQIQIRVAARYQEKKKVPKANGKGTTEVYVYSERQVENRNREKAKRLESFKGKVEKLRGKVKANLGSEDRKTRLVALAVALIDETHERVGNEQSAKGERNDSGEPHYGVTGWKRKHVSLGSGSATIKYVGKSGVKHEKTVTTPYILNALRRAHKEADGKDGCLFTWDDGSVTGSEVNEFLAPFEVSAKDIRGLAANSLMQKALKKARKGTLPEGKEEREKQLKDEFKEALETVSDELGHEASTLKSQYLAPSMEAKYLKDGTIIDKLHE